MKKNPLQKEERTFEGGKKTSGGRNLRRWFLKNITKQWGLVWDKGYCRYSGGRAYLQKEASARGNGARKGDIKSDEEILL